MKFVYRETISPSEKITFTTPIKSVDGEIAGPSAITPSSMPSIMNNSNEWPPQTQTQVSTATLNASTNSDGSMSQWDDSSDDQNSRTRGKLEQLRLVMGERRERRKQRKQKVQPYSLPIPVSVAAEAPPSDTVSA